jgi:hypothetical protein
MDNYGVVPMGDYLFSVPGLLVYLLGIFIILLWSRDRPLWEFIISTILYNVLWNMLGLSFMVLA